MLLATAALTGCAAGHPRTPATVLPPVFEAPASASPVVQLDRWWTLYDDAQLTALIDEALARGFDVREAVARLDEARAVRGNALRQFDPSGNVQGSATRQQTYDLGDGSGLAIGGGSSSGGSQGSGGGLGSLSNGLVIPGRSDSYSLSLPVSWELDLFGRRVAARRTADAEFEASRFAYLGVRTTLAADVADQLFQARGLAVQVADSRETVRIRQELRRVADIRAARGLAPRADVNRVDTELATAQAQLALQEAQLFAARRTLLALLGRASDRLESVPIQGALALPPAVPAGLPADLLTRRPDVLEARARLESAIGRMRTAELAQLPTITLTPSVGLNAQRGVFSSTTGFWSLGASLLVPLLDRARLMTEVRIQDARTEQAVLAFERSVQRAFSESDQAIAKLAADRRRVEMLVRGETRARASYDATLAQYRRGLSDLQGLLDAEATWRAARTQTSAARIDALSRSVQLFKALGGGWSASDPLPSGRTDK
ncbi:efflux transporter outer membrane subunit [uncultured Phenylobacterium sp.]|uniref:efflux transporter outer membrane subunit n=1 Tax=uncultured Phenylobacterium sp. TaxID=349273 RepID=UPI0025F13CB4|nr:TolC family protein [uncultured Phenylobacterium sp.]